MCLPVVLLSSIVSSGSSSASIRIEYLLFRMVGTSLPALCLPERRGSVVYLKVYLPPSIECIVIKGGIVFLQVRVYGPDVFPNPVF